MELNEVYNIDCIDGLKQLPKGYDYCIVTDPPFNMGYHYNQYKDNLPEAEYLRWLQNVTDGLPAVLIHYPEALYKFALQTNRIPCRVVSWVYNSNTLRQHRDIAFFGITPNFEKVRQPYKNMDDKRIIENIKNGMGGGKLYDWIYENQVKNVAKKAIGGIVHPCQMPISLMRKIIGILPENLVIVDPFMGSGTTAIACIQEKRNFIGFEIDASYHKLCNLRINAEKSQLKLF